LQARSGELIFISMLIEKSPSTVFTPFEDATSVLLNRKTRLYYNLNRTGTHIWQQIEDLKTVTLDDLVRAVCERFKVDDRSARHDLDLFTRELEEFDLVRLSRGQGAGVRDQGQ
jgi:coenzyme PQQ synthesis protein D (PqqD)